MNSIPNWEHKEEWRWYGVPNGPYVIEKRAENLYTAWLLGHKCVGHFETLIEAQKICELDAKLKR